MAAAWPLIHFPISQSLTLSCCLLPHFSTLRSSLAPKYEFHAGFSYRIADGQSSQGVTGSPAGGSHDSGGDQALAPASVSRTGRLGKLQEGLNPLSWNMLHFHGRYLGLVIKTGLITAIISLTDGIEVGRTFAALKNYQVDGNKEMIAIGLMNIVVSSTSCYVTTGSFSRSAVNHNAGCKT